MKKREAERICVTKSNQKYEEQKKKKKKKQEKNGTDSS